MFRRFAADFASGRAAGNGIRSALVNGFDRLFRQERLVKADATPYDVLLDSGLLKLRYYPPLAEARIDAGPQTVEVAEKTHRVPLLLVPPLAASTLIFDLLPQRSLVRFLRAKGFEVYLVDFGEPSRKHSHLGVREYTTEMLPAAIERVREHSGQRQISLFGYCMGGLFCLIYAGVMNDPDIHNIVTVASPINMRDSTLAAKILELANLPTLLIRRYTSFRLHQLDPGYLQVPGWMNSLAFKMTDPVGSLMTYWDLLIHLADREYVEVHTTTSRWFDDMLDYPGGIVQDFFVKVGLDNALNTGHLQLGDKESRFERIDCSLLAIAGENDTLVGADSAHAITHLVASHDKTFKTTPGGHAGVFAGGKAPGNTWRIVADWLAERSD